MYESIKEYNTGSEYNSLLSNSKRIFSKDNEKKETSTKKYILGWVLCIIFGAIALYLVLNYKNDGSLISKPASFVVNEQEPDNESFSTNQIIKPNGPPAVIKPNGPPVVLKPNGPPVDLKPNGRPVNLKPNGPPVHLKPNGPPAFLKKSAMGQPPDDSNNNNNNGPNSVIKISSKDSVSDSGEDNGDGDGDGEEEGDDSRRHGKYFNPQPDPPLYKNAEKRGPSKYMTQKNPPPFKGNYRADPGPHVNQDYGSQSESQPDSHDSQPRFEANFQRDPPDQRNYDLQSNKQPSMLKNKYKLQQW